MPRRHGRGEAERRGPSPVRRQSRNAPKEATMNVIDDIEARIKRAVPEVLVTGIGAAAERITDKSRWTRGAAWRMDDAGRRRHGDDDVPDSVDDLVNFEDVLVAAFAVDDGLDDLQPGEITIEELRNGQCSMDAALALELMQAARAAADEIARATVPEPHRTEVRNSVRILVMESVGFVSGALYGAMSRTGNATAENETDHREADEIRRFDLLLLPENETEYREGGEIRRFDRLLLNALNETLREHLDGTPIENLSDHSGAKVMAEVNDGRWQRQEGGADAEDECHERSVKLLLALKDKVASAAGAA